MKEKTYPCNYLKAIHWYNNHYILCNNIVEIDSSVLENMECDEEYPEIYQYYLSDCSKSEVEWLKEGFPSLIFSYSELLDLYVLCVDHFGTSWDYVPIETTIKEAKNG